MLKKKISIESARESEQGIGMKRKNEKGVDDKSQDYAREREVVYKKLKQQNNKFNCFLVRLLSYIRSCFLFHSPWTWIMFTFFRAVTIRWHWKYKKSLFDAVWSEKSC